ncbi:MAG: ATP-binding protein [Sedimentibacter sp.]|uniref:sensor histidine kinase n=1 Tax=Sedimentibacter sp. TaxID=1960295 RepID=UPI0031598A5B
MKKRLFWITMMISLCATIAACLITSYVYYGFYAQNAKAQLRTIVELSKTPENWDNEGSINMSVYNILKSVDYSMRFTIIDLEGIVVYDNWAAARTMENHSDRPEVLEAIQYGRGEDTRYSGTVSSDMYYYAVKLNDSRVLRVSREIKSINLVFAGTMPLLAVFFVLLFMVVYFAVHLFTAKVMRPINEMTGNIDMLEGSSGKEVKIYDEFRPLSMKIKEQKVKINEYIDELRHERDTIGIITENMKEGFILINRDKNILSINSSGKRMIRNKSFSLNGNRNILELTRNKEIIENVDMALGENKHLVYDMDTGSNFYRFYFSPVKEQMNSSVAGLMVLIEDVTFQKKAEIMRSEFSANVSHELKTPLTTMIGFAEMIKEGFITDGESIRKYTGMIHKEGLRLISLIDDIIRLSKIEEGIDAEDGSMADLKEIGNEVVNLLKHKAEDSGVELSIRAEKVYLCANRNYLSELVYNLVDNGIKYNKKGGTVNVDIFKTENLINIRVSDTGMGIPEEHRDRVFERFYRVDKSRSKETGGTGLGLSIVKHIAELYDATVELRSRENMGTQITVLFRQNENM